MPMYSFMPMYIFIYLELSLISYDPQKNFYYLSVIKFSMGYVKI